MEIVIDEHAIRLLRRSSFNDDEMRLIVAALKITNDLERIGDLAVNLARMRDFFAGYAEDLTRSRNSRRWPRRCAPWSAKVWER